MHNGNPALQFVVPVPVKQIGGADGHCCSRCLDGRESRVVVHGIIIQENFLPSTPPHVQRGKIIRGAGRRYAREQPAVLSVPETVWATVYRFLSKRSGWHTGLPLCLRSLRQLLSSQRLCREDRDQAETEQPRGFHVTVHCRRRTVSPDELPRRVTNIAGCCPRFLFCCFMENSSAAFGVPTRPAIL